MEVVGFAASVAGLLAITGQIAKNVLFIKGFLEDTKNAPDEICSLATEIELLGSAAKKTDALLVKCHADGVDFDLEEEKKGLKRYSDMIESLKTKLERDVKTFEVGKGRWWDRVGSAARKKSVEGYMVGVERAKTLVLGIETKITLQLQHGHRQSLITTNQSLEALQLSSDGNVTTLNALKTETTRISNWTGATDQTFTNITNEVQQVSTGIEKMDTRTAHITTWTATADQKLSGISKGVQKLNTSINTLEQLEMQTTQITNWTGSADQRLTSLSDEVQQINTSMNNLLPAIQKLQKQSSPPNELSALESMLESAVMRGLKRHDEELQKYIPRSSSHPPSISETTPEDSGTTTESTDEQLYSGSYAMIRRDKTVFQTAFCTPFFDIKIVTKEAQRTPKPKKGTPLHQLSRLKPTNLQQLTTYSVRVKIPFWRSETTFQSGNVSMMYGGNLCKTFRTYNIIPYRSPIIIACRNFDLPEVQRLFEAGLASPLDCDEYDRSLIDTVISNMAYKPDHGKLASDAIPLLRYLISCLSGDIGRAKSIFLVFFNATLHDLMPEVLCALAEACRLVIRHTSEDPLQGVEHILNIELSTTPLYSVLATQDKWWFDDTIRFGGASSQSILYETDLQMLRDPKALRLEAAMSTGLQYMPYNFQFIGDGVQDYRIHLLLAMASNTMEKDFHLCVNSRLVILLENEIDPRKVLYVYFENIYIGTPAFMMRPLSCTEYAVQLNLTNLWRAALWASGWSHDNIDKLFEEDLSQASIGLLCGEIQYQSRDGQRRQFIDDLRKGKFVNLHGHAISSLSTQWEFELGLDAFEIYHMIKEVKANFNARKIPGGWVDEQDIILVPGKDFNLPSGLRKGDDVKDWKCVRDIWGNELGGCIPVGYEDTEDSDETSERRRRR